MKRMKNMKCCKNLNKKNLKNAVIDNIPGRKKSNPAVKALKVTGLVVGAGLGAVVLGGAAIIGAFILTENKFESN